MHHVGVQVLDLERSLHFYRDVLGFAEVLRTVRTATAHPGTAHTCYVVDDLDAVHADLVRRGVRTVSTRVVAPPAGPMAGGKVVYVQDPDGVRVELVQLPPAR